MGNNNKNNRGEKAPVITPKEQPLTAPLEVKEEIKDVKEETKKEKKMFTITATIDKTKVSLELTDQEVNTAIGICENNGVEEVITMKKHNGAAMFFVNDTNAEACQNRHKFDYSFTISLKDLNKHITK